MSEEFRSIGWGVPTRLAHVLYQDLGFTYKSTFAKGLFISNYSDLVNYGLLPLDGALILKMRGHVSAVVDGVIHDTFDTRKMVVPGAFMLAPNLTDSEAAQISASPYGPNFPQQSKRPSS